MPELPAGAVVTLDGPAGVGKSTTARFLADRFGLLYVDTGAMYRALTWAAQRAGIGPQEGERLAELLRRCRLELRPGQRETQVFWEGVDVTREIRTPAIDAAVSAVSAHAEVRREMVRRQRRLGRAGGVVMEGRDIGSAVFPLAEVKLYLDASLEARTRRRLRQYERSGQAVEPAAIAAELAARDRRDSSRAASPLTIPLDAVVLDSSDWSLPRQQQEICAALAGRLQQDPPAAGPPPDRPLLAKYRAAYAIMGAAARCWGVRVHGREQLDRVPGGAILACNHVSWWDPPVVGSTILRCRVRTLAKAELFRPAPAGAFFRWLDAVPIERSGYDRQAFDTAAAALADGQDVFIFPEGTRRPIGRPGHVRSGLGILVQRSGAPIVPIFVRGTCDVRPGGSDRSPLEVSYGPPLRPRALPALRSRHDPRVINGLIGRFFEAVLQELQERSWARLPQTDWERAEAETQAVRYRRKEERIFGRRRASGPHR